MEKRIIQLEYQMWEAASRKDAPSFKKLVAPNAVMVCGGYRCLGAEYAEFIPDFDISRYTISNMEVIHSNTEEVLLHYILRTEVENENAKDLEGYFHIASLWKKTSEDWQLFFNMDSRIIRGESTPAASPQGQ